VKKAFFLREIMLIADLASFFFGQQIPVEDFAFLVETQFTADTSADSRGLSVYSQGENRKQWDWRAHV
jgi:hypothetical protein